jgi:hypothetical protein
VRFIAGTVALCLPLLLGCGSDDDARRGNGPETEARSVIVPEHDSSPPTATVAIADPVEGHVLAEASWPGEPPSGTVELEEARLRGSAVGEDPDGGIVRVRVSVAERISCQGRDGARFERLSRRYFPPPQIEQIRAAPGARLATRRMRSRLVALAGGRCGAGAEATSIGGRLWGEVINGHGLETITPMVRFSYDP